MRDVIKIDCGFSILENGDVITSDGLPRGDLDAAWPLIFGKPLAFRKPTAKEAPSFAKVDAALDRALQSFVEKR